MYIHLGGDTVVNTKDILGVFDMDTSTVNKATRDYLNKAEKEKRTVYVNYDLPKSFIVVQERKSKKKTVYISQISSQTLNKRNVLKNIYL